MYALSCKTSEVQYWTKLFDKEGIIEEKLKTYASNMDKKVGECLWQLINKTIIKARPPKSNFFTLDGTIYTLIQMIDGKVVKVSKNLTNENSKTGKITTLIDTLDNGIKTNSIGLIQANIQQKISELLE
jgi:hypothetical protein